MAWTYKQLSGWLLDKSGKLVGIGYSGSPAGKNNPSMQEVSCVGPIPCGLYTIEQPINSPTHGPFAMPLVPDPINEMYGRSAFLIHGDSLEHPGVASEGCIILNRTFREAIWSSGDHRLAVISGTEPELEAT